MNVIVLCSFVTLFSGVLFLIGGIQARKSKKPVRMWTFRNIQKVRDIKGYNDSIGKLEIGFSIPFFVAGFLTLASNWYSWTFFAAMVCLILTVFPGLLFVYQGNKMIFKKYHVQFEPR